MKTRFSATIWTFRMFHMLALDRKKLCPPFKRVKSNSDHYAHVGTRNDRTVSSEKIELSSKVDCISVLRSFLLSEELQAPYIFQRIRKWRISISCNNQSGVLYGVNRDDNINTIACNSSAIVRLYRPDFSIETVGTGGFTAYFDRITQIRDGATDCKRFEISQTAQMSASLPLLYTQTLDRHNSSTKQHFYCSYSLRPPNGSDLIVELRMPFSNDQLDQFCLEISAQSIRPKLIFIITKLDGSKTLLSLCNNNIPGGLSMQSNLKVWQGEKLEIDITVAKIFTNWNRSEDSERLLRYNFDVDANFIVSPVQVCTRLTSSSEQWQLSADGTQLLNTMTVPPDNTQTDCKLQLDAFTAARIVNNTKPASSVREISILSKADCWKLEVKLDKFSTVCGLKQLVLTASHWDSLAASVEHMQREVCGSNSQFEFRVEASLQAEGSGMSLAYSGVRSGFRARLSISSCVQSSAQSEQLVESPASVQSASSFFIFLVVLLSLANVFVLIFMFRKNIWRQVTHWIGAAQQRQAAQSVLNTSEADHLNLLSDVQDT
uniref:CUB domain-containing protein n=1 Tax=Macrostomum lignano TaxID=282301 RepID=A0A1I8G3H3_9PLAT